MGYLNKYWAKCHQSKILDLVYEYLDIDPIKINTCLYFFNQYVQQAEIGDELE